VKKKKGFPQIKRGGNGEKMKREDKWVKWRKTISYPRKV
jgi:hypothetical protein